MVDLIRALAAKTPLVPSISELQASDLLAYLGGPESYRQLVLVDGWSVEDWMAWVERTLRRELFGV